MNGRLEIRKFGNSAGVILPKELLAHLNVGVGETVAVIKTPHGIELRVADADVDAQMTIARGRQVHILRCFEGNHPHFSKPTDETFGASLGELLRKTFLINYNERNFDVLVRELVERHGAAKVRAELGDELALSARLLLDKLGEEP